MPDQPPRIDSALTPGVRRVWPRRLLLGSLLLLAGGTAGYAWYLRAGPDPPTVDVSDLEPAAAQAIGEARNAVVEAPRSAEAWGRLGLLLHAYEFPDPAAFCFTRAERLDPRDPRWPASLGIVVAPSDAEAALRHLQQALARGGDRSDAIRLRLANALLEQGRANEAQGHLEEVLRQGSASPPALLGLGRVACARGEWREGLVRLRHCAHHPTTRKAARTLMAAAYQRLGESSAAEQELQLLAALPPDVPWPDPFADELAQVRVDRMARLQLADRLLTQGRPPEALAILGRLVQEHPDFTPAWRALGYVLLRCGDLQGAERTLQTALEQMPDSAETLFYLGCVAMNRRRPAESVDYLRRATAIRPDYAMAHFNLGKCLRLQGDTADAIDAFRQAVRCRPYLAEAHQYLGELLAQAGKPAEAMEHLRSAIDLDPADRKSKELLERLQR
jgi:tetratricopeptide (TPR) repeat protein